MLVYGTRYFGKVDEVPGHFHVATRCRHLWYLPLVPLDSWVILEGTRTFDPGGEWSAGGVRLPSIRWRSVLCAWGRYGLVWAVLVAAVTGLVPLLDVAFDAVSPKTALVRLTVAAGALVSLWLSYRLSRASRARAEALCRFLGLSEESTSVVRRRVAGR